MDCAGKKGKGMAVGVDFRTNEKIWKKSYEEWKRQQFCVFN